MATGVATRGRARGGARLINSGSNPKLVARFYSTVTRSLTGGRRGAWSLPRDGRGNGGRTCCFTTLKPLTLTEIVTALAYTV
jgi:hypothetical protein